MTSVIVDGPDGSTIHPYRPPWNPYRGGVNPVFSGVGTEPEHVYISVQGKSRKVYIGTPQDLSESEISALRDASFTVEEVA
jgi:hypothetical protein